MITRYVIRYLSFSHPFLWAADEGYFSVVVEGVASNGEPYSVSIAELDDEGIDWYEVEGLEDQNYGASTDITGAQAIEALRRGLNSPQFGEYLASL